MKYPPGLSTLLSSNNGFPPAIPSSKLVKKKMKIKNTLYTTERKNINATVVCLLMNIVKR
jgi:hypothetical protein